MTYAWTGMQDYFKVKAQVVGEMMERLESELGSVTKENFLLASKPIDSPTHGLFEWDDSKAAEKYRLHQSQNVINHIAVKVEVKEGEEPQQIRAYVNVEPSGGTSKGRFVNIIKAMSDDETRAVVVRNALRELQMFQDKYKAYSEFQSVFDAIKNISVA